ncbi:SCO6745 family protein [Nocardia niigatensis]|uniref:SCO6745 family protein n=1 Tax=Nocardia niigatensis TaxID=209249 RepID=UPI00030D8C97|nr:hypothetical protein [Nocardia niigatensis]
MNNALARDVWRVIEPLHAVTYFAADCIAANKAVGLRGFWMGYFAARSAPLGAAGPSVVEATFYNFHPAMVRRAIPDAWSYATPDAVLATRTLAAAAVLRGIVPDIATVAARAVPHLRRAIEAAPAAGRPLFAANRDLPAPGDPVHALWQAVTALREHRGDGHVACLVAEGIDGCEAHVLFSASTGMPAQVMRDNRGWSETDWQAAQERLTDRGLLNGDGLTEAGRALREHIEARTDTLAMTAYRGIPGILETLSVLTPAARAVARSGEVPYPNPMGADPA